MEIQRIRREKELTVCKVPLEPEPTNPNACHLQIKLGERTMKRLFLMSDTLEVRHLFLNTFITTFFNIMTNNFIF